MRTRKESGGVRVFYREPLGLAENSLRYFQHRNGNHVVAMYCHAGEDIEGPAAVYSFATIDQARVEWTRLLTEMKARGYTQKVRRN